MKNKDTQLLEEAYGQVYRSPSLVSILKKVLNDIGYKAYPDDDEQFSVNWKGLAKAVRDEGIRNDSKYDAIKDAVIDLFHSIGYEEFGILDIGEQYRGMHGANHLALQAP
jgi:hypothetical protein